MTTRRSASPPRARGSRSSATSRSSASTRRPTSSPSSASATCPATCSATGCCCPSTSGSWPPTTTGTSSSTRPRTRRSASRSASGCSSCRARRGTTTTRELISEGGGVFPRTAKSIPLSPQAREALGHRPSESLPPTDVIRAILRAPVDLLWNGGIGTLVKASTETDADAHDRSSDAIRVDANELRAKVVGEGGNLGFTRRARVEYAAGGGRDQRRLHRQLGRRRLLRPRGQPEDPARAGRAARRADPRRARRAAVRRHRRRHRARALRLVPAGADHRPGGRSLAPRGCSPTRT